MKVSLIGMGCGPETLTAGAAKVLQDADLLIGASALLDRLPVSLLEKLKENHTRIRREYHPDAIAKLLADSQAGHPCILLGGDSGFYSGAAGLLPLLKEQGIETEILPGISSLQYLAARLGRPWQDWRLCSAHGMECDAVYEVMQGQPVFFLTSGEESLHELCGALSAAGLGELQVTIGEDLGLHSERITVETAAMAAGRKVSRLNVLLAEAAPRGQLRGPGIPDDEFIRDKVPITKQEVRALIMAKLAVGQGDVCWDIGAGTGSVSIELAMQARSVWAIEREKKALELTEKNRLKFCAWNLHLVAGEAPGGLSRFPRPDVVFIGGSGGCLEGILNTVYTANPKARILISAITLETLQTAQNALQTLGLKTEVTQISVSRTKEINGYHLLMGENPVFLILGEQPANTRT